MINNTGFCFKIILLLIIMMFFFFPSFAQKSKAKKKSTDEVYQTVEVMPEFPGGDQALIEFIAANVVYPPVARMNDIEGVTYLKFVIGKKGNVEDISVAKSSGHAILDEAAVACIQKMPDWKPGRLKKRGKPIRVQYVVPIKFRLN